jgi:hypothetical protein
MEEFSVFCTLAAWSAGRWMRSRERSAAAWEETGTGSSFNAPMPEDLSMGNIAPGVTSKPKVKQGFDTINS